MRVGPAIFAVLGTFAFSGVVHAQGDAERGEDVFVQCIACHTVEPDEHGVGPSLHGVMGRASGSVEDFTYSEEFQSVELTWNDETLAEFLRDPEAMVPGTLMVFPGLEDDQELADVIAYLHQFSQ